MTVGLHRIVGPAHRDDLRRRGLGDAQIIHARKHASQRSDRSVEHQDVVPQRLQGTVRRVRVVEGRTLGVGQPVIEVVAQIPELIDHLVQQDADSATPPDRPDDRTDGASTGSRPPTSALGVFGVDGR